MTHTKEDIELVNDDVGLSVDGIRETYGKDKR